MTSGHRPKGLLAILTFALLIGIVALVLSFQNALNLDRQAEARNRDRIASDVASCERGNTLRRQVIDLADSNVAMVDGILDVIFASTSHPDELAALRRKVDEPIAAYQARIGTIKLTDCTQVTPGARRTP